MAKIRILVVDDAVVFRRAVSDALASDPALEVVGTASNGRIALAMLPQVSPDLVILDVEMPEMDGLATLKQLRKTYPCLPVIMFSALTERGAEATLDALAFGATDYFTKPTSTGGLEASLTVIKEELIPEIKALFASAAKQAAAAPAPAASSVLPTAPPRPASIPPPQQSRPRTGPVKVLAIGASTGGPNALTELFGRLPKDFPVPILIVQHMPPMFTRLLAERMSAQFPICVQEGIAGGVLQPGNAWIAPGDFHMTVARDSQHVRILLNQDPPEHSCRPAVDVMLRSVVKAFGSNVLAVILTGMGQDGLRGCEAVREAGGQILAQDEATSVVWGMPGYVARAGLADRVLPVSLIADEIMRRLQPISAVR
jgi:two-component system, chemotaxis family, protein-glutamate methylesterase/glutaminase